MCGASRGMPPALTGESARERAPPRWRDREARGETLEEARAYIREAVELVLEANRALSVEDLAGAEVIRERLIA